MRQQVILPDRNVEKIARRNAGWVGVVVLGPSGRNLQVLGAVFRSRANAIRTDRCSGRGIDARAKESCFILLVGSKVGSIYDGVGPVRSVCTISPSARHGACYQAAVVAPIKAEPRPVLLGLILQVSGLVVDLVVIDAEDRRVARRCQIGR